jgi:hypothetical protein
MKALIKPADLPIEWQGIHEHTTQRGRVKAILTGIPGTLFWHHWKHQPGFKDQLRDAQITVMRIEKGKWQVVLWINHRNAPLVQDLGYQVPEVSDETATQPF